MTKKHEELVEEIQARMLQIPSIINLGQVVKQPEGKELLAETFLRVIIQDVLRAVVDGLELPGEVARITSEVEGPFINALRGHTYIVLNPGEEK